MRRSSHALIVDSGVWLVDPIDAPDLDDHLATRGTVAGVILTLARHTRDAHVIAERHGVGVWADGVLGTIKGGARVIAERVPNTPLMSVPIRGRGLRRWWREAAIWWPEAHLCVVGESLGNPPYYLLEGERLGLHPVMRGQPPPALGHLDINRLLCGHGDGLAANAGSTIREVLANGPARRSAFWMLTTVRAYRQNARS